MIVNNLDLRWSSVCPHEADPPLVINSDAVLSGTVALEGLEPISWRDTKIVKDLCGPHLAKLAQSNRVNPRINRPNTLTTPQPLGVFVSERSDHQFSI